MKRLGAYYRENVLSLPKKSLTKKEAPYASLHNITLEKDLFGWKLYYTRPGRKSHMYIECRSEEEARFLKVFFEVGLTEVCVPKDDEYLKSILPELERLKNRSDEIIDLYTEGVLSPKIKEKVRYEVYMELIK